MRRSCYRGARTSKGSVALCAAIPILLLAFISCRRSSEPGQNAGAGVAFQFGEHIGWFHGSCLAISNASLAAGTHVALVFTGAPQKVQQARIRERATTPATCQPLMEGRAKMNAKPGISFYTLDAGSTGATDMGFGLAPPPANLRIVNGLATVDLDQDGQSEVFTSCATHEGMKFAVWTGKAYQGEPRWSGYYYLDYEMTPTCP